LSVRSSGLHFYSSWRRGGNGGPPFLTELQTICNHRVKLRVIRSLNSLFLTDSVYLSTPEDYGKHGQM